ncbi:unnamed protein product [Caenorhabditis angaria]|uniref:Uncharacterized protein n=1 Tax=Caenorhabditis angaria TaxID=860376 RepID=A0A9P1I6K2_9PELO|nr:unnamed protein product [Caenorhabditis angaria]
MGALQVKPRKTEKLEGIASPKPSPRKVDESFINKPQKVTENTTPRISSRNPPDLISEENEKGKKSPTIENSDEKKKKPKKPKISSRESKAERQSKSLPIARCPVRGESNKEYQSDRELMENGVKSPPTPNDLAKRKPLHGDSMKAQRPRRQKHNRKPNNHHLPSRFNEYQRPAVVTCDPHADEIIISENLDATFKYGDMISEITQSDRSQE